MKPVNLIVIIFFTVDHTKDNYPIAAPMTNPAVSAPTKDDAYQQFLREMEELL